MTHIVARVALQRPRPVGRPATLQDGRFLLLEILGRGAEASVYRAFDRVRDGSVALKIPRAPVKPLAADPLTREFEAWAPLRHPNIVEAREISRAARGPFSDGRRYLVLEHVRGSASHLAVDAAGADRRNWLDACAIQLLRALDHLHAAGWVHRDLKPSNVLVRTMDDGLPLAKLTDFGLATRAGAFEKPGIVNGSLPYVAPETLLGHPIDGRADLYSLGLLLYRLAFGRTAAPVEDGARAVLTWHLSTRAPEDSEGDALSTALADCLKRLTRRAPEERPRDAGEALCLLGAMRVPVSSDTKLGRAERACLRLALDATCRGGRSVFRVPGHPTPCQATLSEASTWAQIRGIRFHRIAPGNPWSEAGIGRTVLGLLAELGRDEAIDCIRGGLDRALGIGLAGDSTIPYHGERTALEDLSVTLAGTAIARFLTRVARRRPILLAVESTGEDRLLQEVALRLERISDGTGRGPGGLLLMLPAQG